MKKRRCLADAQRERAALPNLSRQIRALHRDVNVALGALKAHRPMSTTTKNLPWSCTACRDEGRYRLLGTHEVLTCTCAAGQAIKNRELDQSPNQSTAAPSAQEI